jgi:hypothetical protein
MVITGFAVTTEYRTGDAGHRTEVSDSLSQAGTEQYPATDGSRSLVLPRGGSVPTVIDSCQLCSGEAMAALLANSMVSAFVLVGDVT